MVGVFLLAVLVVFGIGLIFSVQWLVLPIGIAIGVLAAISIFGRRVQRSVYAKAEGQPGAAGWALDNMRGSGGSRRRRRHHHLDAVHRVIGRPGIILVAEGAPHRVKGLLAQEKKRNARVVGKHPDLRHRRGQRRRPGSVGQAAAPPREAAPQHLHRRDGLPRDRLAALGSRTAALPKGPLPAGAKMRSVQRTVRRR